MSFSTMPSTIDTVADAVTGDVKAMPPQCVVAVHNPPRPYRTSFSLLSTNTGIQEIPVHLYVCGEGSKNTAMQPIPGHIASGSETTLPLVTGTLPSFMKLVDRLRTDLNHLLADVGEPFEYGGFVGIALHYTKKSGSAGGIFAVNEDTWDDAALLLKAGRFASVRLSAYTWPKTVVEGSFLNSSAKNATEGVQKVVIKARH